MYWYFSRPWHGKDLRELNWQVYLTKVTAVFGGSLSGDFLPVQLINHRKDF